MEIKVTIGFNPETLAALTGLVAAMTGGAPVKQMNGSANGAPKPTISKPVEAKAPVSGTVTLEELRALVQSKAQVGKKEEVKTLLKSFSVKSVSEVPEESYTEFFNQVSAL